MNNSMKKLVNKNKNRNIRFVKVKKDRFCKHCGKVIPRGTECLTVNKKQDGRLWYCMRCVDLKFEINRVRAEKECIAFGDEGAWLALNDFESELESEYENLE